MRTNIDIDDHLLAEAQRVSGLKRKKDVVQEGLRLLIRLDGQKEIRKWRGRLHWEDDRDESGKSEEPQ